MLALLYFTLILPAFSLGKNGLGERLRETLSCPVVQSSGPSGRGGGLCFGIGGLEFVVNDILRSLDVLPNAILFFLSFLKVNSDLFSKSAPHRQEKCARRRCSCCSRTALASLQNRWQFPTEKTERWKQLLGGCKTRFHLLSVIETYH